MASNQSMLGTLYRFLEKRVLCLIVYKYIVRRAAVATSPTMRDQRSRIVGYIVRFPFLKLGSICYRPCRDMRLIVA